MNGLLIAFPGFVANEGEWHHGALVVNEGASLRVPNTLLYIDGQRDSTFSGSDNIYNLQPSTDVSIGRRATSNDRFFPGSIDEVRIYDRALIDAEIALLWPDGPKRLIDPNRITPDAEGEASRVRESVHGVWAPGLLLIRESWHANRDMIVQSEWQFQGSIQHETKQT
ncbi:MAG: LamG domain-containing protein [Planctomycetes bacterium]|nr:LamG domain-containing protein [Planctomycetota bacterium]